METYTDAEGVERCDNCGEAVTPRSDHGRPVGRPDPSPAAADPRAHADRKTRTAQADEREVCSRCGADLLLDNPSPKASDDLCRDCRYEEDGTEEEV